MNCKACGEPIPSHLLRQDSFRCPACGRAYHRGTKPASASTGSKAVARAPEKRAPRARMGSPKLPNWLLPAVAALLVLALVVGGVWLLKRRAGAPGISGTVQMETITTGNRVEVEIEIPRHRGNYMIATESNQVGVVVAVNSKTETSFTLAVRNIISKDRNPLISWVLLPCNISD